MNYSESFMPFLMSGAKHYLPAMLHKKGKKNQRRGKDPKKNNPFWGFMLLLIIVIMLIFVIGYRPQP